MEPVNAPAPARSLAELEAVIERGMQTFVDVGIALAEIRDQRLYRETHSDFDSYCRARWGFNRQRAYQMIEAATVTTELSKILDTETPLPISDSTARELTRVDPERRAETWQAAVEQHGPEPTAKQVRETVAARHPELIPTRVLTPAQTGFIPGPQREPIDVQPMPEPASTTLAMLQRLPEERVDALADMFLDAQLPDMVAEVVLTATGMLLKVIRHATKELQRIDWSRVTDEMRASETVVKHIGYVDKDWSEFEAALQQVRLPAGGLRRVK